MTTGKFYVEGKKEKVSLAGLEAKLDLLLQGSGSHLDGVYFNPVEGASGTDWPTGTPGRPVDNLADAMTLMLTRNLRKLYLVGSRAFYGTHTTANHPTIMTDANNTFTPDSLIGWTIYNSTDGSSGVITANGKKTIAVAALVGGGANIWTTGDDYYIADAFGGTPYHIIFDQNVDLELVGNGLYDILIVPRITVTFTSGLVCNNLYNTTGTINILGNCQVGGSISQTDIGTIAITGNCKAGNDLLNTTGTINILGNCQVAGGLSNTTGHILINGDCVVCGSLANTTGTIEIYGNCQVSGALGQTNTGDIIVYGNCQVAYYLANTGGGNVVIMGKLDIDGPSCDGGGFLDNTDGLSVYVGNDCHVARQMCNSTGNIRICGDCEVGDNIEQVDTGGIYIYGNCKIAGDLTNESEVKGGTIEFKEPEATVSLPSADSEVERIVSRGSLKVSHMVAGATAIIDLCGGILTIAAACTGGTIDLYSDCTLTDLSGAAVTVNDLRVPGHS